MNIIEFFYDEEVILIEPKILQYILALASERNFTKAAKKLHLAQPSLSYQISKLEKNLDVQLFVREYNEVTPTYAGSVVIDYATNILNMYRHLNNELSDIGGMRQGELSVGSITSTGAHLLPNAISAFRKKYPGIQVKLIEDTSDNLQGMISSGEIETAIMSTPIKNTHLETEVIREEELLLAVPPGHWLSMYAEVDLALCREESFIAIKSINNFRFHTDDLCKKAGFVPKVVFESININTCQSLVLAGIGITFVPRMFINEIELPEKPVYIPLLVDGRTPTRAIVSAYKNIGYLSKASREFIEILKEQSLENYLGLNKGAHL